MNNASIPKRFGLVAFLAAALRVLATSVALAATVTGTSCEVIVIQGLPLP